MPNGYEFDVEEAYDAFEYAEATHDVDEIVLAGVVCRGGHFGLVAPTPKEAIEAAQRMNLVSTPNQCEYIPLPILLTEGVARARNEAAQSPENDG